ncbi:hypothetical protein AB7M69_011277 [Bradyrhizobium japonicum]
MIAPVSPHPEFHDLLSLADFFDPQNPYLNKVQPASGSSSAAPTTGVASPGAASEVSSASDVFDSIRKVLSTFFSDDAKILGVVSYRQLLQVLGFDTTSLLGATPVLRETLQFGSDAALNADPQELVQDIHAHVLAPLQDAINKLETQWQKLSRDIQSQFPREGG